MIDVHTHLLAGLDDGPATLAGSIALAAEAVAAGTSTLIATPHVRADYPTTIDEIDLALAAVEDELAAAGIDVEVLSGAEVAFDYLDELSPGELVAFSLGGSETYILIEPPVFGWPLDARARVRALRALGLTVVLAHPERNVTVQSSPARLVELIAEGALIQVTAASLVGGFGPAAKRSAKALISEGMAHLVASDVHHAGGRGAALGPALETIRDRALVQWLTVEVPSAVVDGEPIPRRPAARRRWSVSRLR